jgi:hypothetical protein
VRTGGSLYAFVACASREPGYPAADGASVITVRLAELSPERGLFDKDDEDIGDREPDGPVDEQPKGMRHHVLANEDEAYGEVHRVPHITIEPLHDQFLRRICR